MAQTFRDLVSIEIKIGELKKLLLDNKVVAGKAKDVEINTLWSALHTAIQASSQVAGSDFFELS
jgi:hypothetical protein